MQGGETAVCARRNELYCVQKPDGRGPRRGEEERVRQDKVKRKSTCVCVQWRVCVQSDGVCCVYMSVLTLSVWAWREPVWWQNRTGGRTEPAGLPGCSWRPSWCHETEGAAAGGSEGGAAAAGGAAAGAGVWAGSYRRAHYETASVGETILKYCTPIPNLTYLYLTSVLSFHAALYFLNPLHLSVVISCIRN